MVDPLHQFLIHPILPIHFMGVDLSFTNASLFMVLSSILIVAFFHYGLQKMELLPGRFQTVTEGVYNFIVHIIQENAGPKAMAYLPLVMTIFLFIFMGNFLGLMPYSFTFTSHIIVTFALALGVFITVTIIGLIKHGFHFFSLFVFNKSY